MEIIVRYDSSPHAEPFHLGIPHVLNPTLTSSLLPFSCSEAKSPTTM